MKLKSYFAYFYKQNSIPCEGWRDRRTVTCNDKGQVSKADYNQLYDWVFLGFYELGKEPSNLWDKAKVL